METKTKTTTMTIRSNECFRSYSESVFVFFCNERFEEFANDDSLAYVSRLMVLITLNGAFMFSTIRREKIE